MPLSARELFARIIRCEAEGEGDNGMKAVAKMCIRDRSYRNNMSCYSGAEWLDVYKRQEKLQP